MSADLGQFLWVSGCEEEEAESMLHRFKKLAIWNNQDGFQISVLPLSR